MADAEYRTEFPKPKVRNLGEITCADCGSTCIKRQWMQRRCEACANIWKIVTDKKYYEANCERLKAQSRVWGAEYRKRPDVKERKRSDESKARERQREFTRYKRHGEKRRAHAAKWYAENREKVLARASSEEGRAYSRNRMREKMKDPTFRAFASVSRGIRASIKDKNRRVWEDVVGYTASELRTHLERQFTRGMTWENYGQGPGRWHIDHIVPRTAFNFQSAGDPEFRACWAITNLRPLWSAENIRKHAKRTHLI